MTIENNLLNPINFYFKLSKTPNVEYLVQGVGIPGVNLGSIQTPTPFVRVTNPGNMTYDDLRVTFKVGENLTSYLEIYNWMVELSRPDSFDQYKYTASDASVLILNSARRPIIDVSFTDVFPTSISPIDFDATLEDIQYVTVDATFSFDRMYFNI